MSKFMMTLIALVASPSLAFAGCFCDPSTQSFERSDKAADCVEITPTTGCLGATVRNACAGELVLKSWPGEGADKTIPVGASLAVVIHPLNQAVPASTALEVTIGSGQYTITHVTVQSCDAACSAGRVATGGGAAPPAALLTLMALIGVACLGRRRAARWMRA